MNENHCFFSVGFKTTNETCVWKWRISSERAIVLGLPFLTMLVNQSSRSLNGHEYPRILNWSLSIFWFIPRVVQNSAMNKAAKENISVGELFSELLGNPIHPLQVGMVLRLLMTVARCFPYQLMVKQLGDVEKWSRHKCWIFISAEDSIYHQRQKEERNELRALDNAVTRNRTVFQRRVDTPNARK